MKSPTTVNQDKANTYDYQNKTCHDNGIGLKRLALILGIGDDLVWTIGSFRKNIAYGIPEFNGETKNEAAENYKFDLRKCFKRKGEYEKRKKQN